MFNTSSPFLLFCLLCLAPCSLLLASRVLLLASFDFRCFLLAPLVSCRFVSSRFYGLLFPVLIIYVMLFSVLCCSSLFISFLCFSFLCYYFFFLCVSGGIYATPLPAALPETFPVLPEPSGTRILQQVLLSFLEVFLKPSGTFRFRVSNISMIF